MLIPALGKMTLKISSGAWAKEILLACEPKDIGSYEFAYSQDFECGREI